METTVSGKKVVLRTKYPSSENRDLFKVFRAMSIDDLGTVPPVALRMVESWEFEGDPADAASYDALDAFDLLGLQRAISDFWTDRLKNLNSKSIAA